MPNSSRTALLIRCSVEERNEYALPHDQSVEL